MNHFNGSQPNTSLFVGESGEIDSGVGTIIVVATLGAMQRSTLAGRRDVKIVANTCSDGVGGR